MDGKKIVRRIWILNHHASGNGDRHDALANQLTKFGVEIFVIASSYFHTEHRYIFEGKCTVQDRGNGLRYAWLRTSPTYQVNGLNRIFNMISYLRMVKKFARQWCRKYGKPDVVIGSSVHPFAWEAAYWISKRTGADFYVEVRDLWPLSLIEVQGVSSTHPLVGFFRIIEKRAYNRAKKIITTMPYSYKYLSDTLGVSRDKIVWIPNGIDTEKVDEALEHTDIKLPDELNAYLEANWCAVYTGSFVESECIDHILASAKLLQSRNNVAIKFAIVGDGHLRAQLLELAKKKELENVRFFRRITKEQVAIALSKSKVCLAAIHNLPLYKFGLSMNKLNDYLYSGNPTVFVCDVDNVVKVSGGGITLPYGEVETFANAIESVYNMSEHERREMGERGKKTIREQYDSAILAKQLLTLFESNCTE